MTKIVLDFVMANKLIVVDLDKTSLFHPGSINITSLVSQPHSQWAGKKSIRGRKDYNLSQNSCQGCETFAVCLRIGR
jgi:hypothetical protein